MKNFLHGIADYIRETDKLLLLICLTASFYGTVLIYSATYSTGDIRQVLVQAASVAIGVAAAIFISLFDYKTIARRWYIWVGLCVALLIVTFIWGYAPQGTSNKAWLELPGGMSFQPSELVKIAFIITFSLHIHKVRDQINRPKNLLLLCAHGAFPALLIHFLQGDDGTALILAFIFACMLFVSGVKLRYFIIAGAALAAAAPFIWFFVLNSYQRNRILIVFNPESDLLGNGWQQWRGRIAIGSGGLTGYGFLQGPRIQSGNVPKAYNDFIFATAGEELGFFGCMAVLILLCALCLRILRVARLSRDKMGAMICTGVFAMFSIQTIINIGMCLSLLPVIGITLPFFSAGGTSLVSLFIGIGLILSVYIHRGRRRIYLRDDF